MLISQIKNFSSASVSHLLKVTQLTSKLISLTSYAAWHMSLKTSLKKVLLDPISLR